MILVEDFVPNQLFEKYFLVRVICTKKKTFRCVKVFTPHVLRKGTLWCYNNSHIFLPVWQLCQQDVDGLCKYLYLQTCFSFSHHENCLQGLYCGGRALHTAALSSTSEQLITRHVIMNHFLTAMLFEHPYIMQHNIFIWSLQQIDPIVSLLILDGFV